MYLLECASLGLSYLRKKVLDDICLTLNKGEFIGLIGPNGAGKSSLLKLLMGIQTPTQGQVLLAQRPLAAYSRRHIAQHMSFVPQEMHIDYALSVRQIIAMGRNPHLGVFQPQSQQDLQIIAQAAEKADVTDFLDRSIDKLSGGERQRVFIARALAQEAPILLMDEPTSSLDLCHQLDILHLVRSLTEEGHLAILAMHNLEMASRFCQRLILLSQGRVVADGKPKEVLTKAHLKRYFSVEAQVEATCSSGVRITALKSYR